MKQKLDSNKLNKLYECRAAAKPRLDRIMENLDPNFYWSIQESPDGKAFLMDVRNNSWGNSPTPAQQKALDCFYSEVMLRGSNDFKFEMYGQLYKLDKNTGKCHCWTLDETLLEWKSKEIELVDYIRIEDYYKANFGSSAEEQRAAASKTDMQRLLGNGGAA